MSGSDPTNDCPRCPNGHACGTPIRHCHRPDVADWHVEHEGANLWCPCCGCFWKGDADALLHAEMSYIAFEEKWQKEREPRA